VCDTSGVAVRYGTRKEDCVLQCVAVCCSALVLDAVLERWLMALDTDTMYLYVSSANASICIYNVSICIYTVSICIYNVSICI